MPHRSRRLSAVRIALTLFAAALARPAGAQELDLPALGASASVPLAFDVSSDGFDTVRADAHAPIGVENGHFHSAGGWLLSYRYQRTFLEGNLDGTTSLSAQEVLSQGYTVTPIEMSTERHLFGAQVAPADWLTLSALVPYVIHSMDNLTDMGEAFTTDTEGLGDVRLDGLVPVYRGAAHRAHLSLGVFAPTGATDERGVTPSDADAKLPYPMQLGSGTWDLIGGGTWVGQVKRFSYGAQALGTVRLGENSEEYRLGDRGEASLWGAWTPDRSFSTSLRLRGETWGNIDGADPELDPAAAPTADPDLRGGTRVDAGVGLIVAPQYGALKRHRLSIEFLVPFFQDLDGPQLETAWTLVAGWQVSF